MLEGAKRQMMQRAMQKATPSETPAVQVLAETIAKIEREQAEALVRLVEAVDAEVAIDPPTVQARKDRILGFADAVSDERVPEWWAETNGVEKPERAAEYAGLDWDEWSDQLRDWHALHFERGTVDDDPDDADPERHREVAARHVESVYGVPLETFETVVVDYQKAAVMEGVLAGQIRQHSALIDELAAAQGDE